MPGDFYESILERKCVVFMQHMGKSDKNSRNCPIIEIGSSLDRDSQRIVI